jgi:hypothetical protein
MGDPTTAANMTDLRAKYQRQKEVYDGLVQNAVTEGDFSNNDAILAAQRAMSETLSQMAALSVSSGADPDEQRELIRRVMEIQRDYNGLLVGTDKIQTLRMIHQTEDVKKSTAMQLMGVLFVAASLGLLIVIMRTR